MEKKGVKEEHNLDIFKDTYVTLHQVREVKFGINR